ncbi:speckle-type POZ protein-like isoform X2 [Argiope bruennichi]|uniref:speckle-type POZ protein-like isoform X2 n=1 Tax=Argiope bruennichi TaxID=94029 RepID=UPI002494E52C|nr:speckle-type POZ protein-like isoform X2 [Argiope bruennichi]
MASRNDGKRKCFTFIWKLENASYCGQFDSEYVESPAFKVDEIHETKWRLEIHALCTSDDIGVILQRQGNGNDDDVIIDYEFAFLSADGIVLKSLEGRNVIIEKDGFIGSWDFASRNEVFFERREEFLSQDTLTACCRIWKSAEEISKDVQCFASTRIVVEKRSFMWNIENFSTLETGIKHTYEIESINTDEKFMTLELFLTGGFIFEEAIRFQIIPNFQNIKSATLQVCIIDASKNAMKCFQSEFWIREPSDANEFSLFYSKKELMEQKSVYLPNDILSLWCECTCSSGKTLEEIDLVNSDSTAIEKKKPGDRILEKRNELPVHKGNLIADFKSLLNDNIVSDIKLKTSNKTYPVHKCILSVRSPVFKAMFSNDMKEKVNECVNIEDLNEDTVLRMLRYIYSAEVEEWEWDSATELYEAADKYQILDLKDICSSYLKDHLCLSNACEALVLADLHHDNNLKEYIQHFILRHGKDIIYSDEWEELMNSNVKLAAETMRLKFKD